MRPLRWYHFQHVPSPPDLTCLGWKLWGKQGGTPERPGEAGMLWKLGGSEGGSRSPNLEVTSHRFIMFPVGGKKKKKKAERGVNPPYISRGGGVRVQKSRALGYPRPEPAMGTWWFWYPWIPGDATSALVPFPACSRIFGIQFG